jgi:hypothetical protein
MKVPKPANFKIYTFKIPDNSPKTLMDPKLSPERPSTNSNEFLKNPW